ncbi:phosphate acyltransferase [Teredinibacter turnerae]|uniref:phosphate acyltransferase n=1 Tax=Teredinibacter turnerae TaxID=2426 RepID=UPI000372A036|nr:phosphate acyltransferase [Teredinibacter turnerae]
MKQKHIPRIAFPEYIDPRVSSAIEKSESQGLIKAVRPNFSQNANTKNEIITSLYEAAVKLVEDGVADGIIAGACASKKDIIKIILKNNKGNLKNRLFTIAPLRLKFANTSNVTYMLDPIIKTKKSAPALKEVIIQAISFFSELTNREPLVALITNNEHEEDTEEIFKSFTNLYSGELSENLYPYPVQLDVALNKKIREYKLKLTIENADILVFDDLTSANIFYKSASLLQNATSGAIMLGLKKGIYGLISRGAEKDEILRLIKFVSTRYNSTTKIKFP